MKRTVILIFLIVSALIIIACSDEKSGVSDTSDVTETFATEDADSTGAETNAENESEADTETSVSKTVDVFDTENVVLSFWVLSDIHYGYLDQASKLATALTFINANSPYGNDALVFAGDIENSRQSNESMEFRKIIDAYIPSEVPAVYCLGPTHDIRESFESVSDSTYGRSVIYKKLGTRFKAASVETQEELDFGRRHSIINGYHFFAIDGEGYALTDESKEWLISNLKAVTEAEPDKPVFVIGHMEIFGEACNDFPQVVYFSGHTHVPFNTGDAIKQTTYTSVHIGGLAYYRQYSCLSSGYLEFERTTASYAQGYRVDVDKNGCVCLSRADFYYGAFLNEKWVIPAVNDENHLTSFPNSRRSGMAPGFGADAMVEISRSKTHPETVTVSFDAAKSNSNEPITQYVISLYSIGDDGKETYIESKEISSLYMLYPNGEGMPSGYTAVFDNVGVNIKLKVTVSVFDCWSIGLNTLNAELK